MGVSSRSSSCGSLSSQPLLPGVCSPPTQSVAPQSVSHCDQHTHCSYLDQERTGDRCVAFTQWGREGNVAK